MSKFLETYGVAIFTLVLVAILIAFAGPLGMKIKNATTDKVCQTEQIGKDEITVAKGELIRPAEPTEAVDQVYCIFYDDGEMTISQNEIEPETGRTVKRKGFYSKPKDCVNHMTTVKFVGAVKPTSCYSWFDYCTHLTRIENIQNLYTNECTDISSMFEDCRSLTTIDVSNFSVSKVTDMSAMFWNCYHLTNINFGDKFDTSNVTNLSFMFKMCYSLTCLDLSCFNTSKATSMSKMFSDCNALTSIKFGNNFVTTNVTNMSWMFSSCTAFINLDISHFDTSKVTDMTGMFNYSDNLTSIKVSQATYDKLITVSNLGISTDKFDIIN